MKSVRGGSVLSGQQRRLTNPTRDSTPKKGRAPFKHSTKDEYLCRDISLCWRIGGGPAPALT